MKDIAHSIGTAVGTGIGIALMLGGLFLALIAGAATLGLMIRAFRWAAGF